MGKKRTGLPNKRIPPWKTRSQATKHERTLTMKAEYDQLTTQQKLSKLDAGNFRALKQRARLRAQLEKETKR